MKSELAKNLEALCAMHEDDFTKKIIKPLFESMGFERVEFNGGPYERGRDLIAQRKIPPRKEMYVAYVQSKKIGKFQNTKTAAAFSTLIHQLRQYCQGKITDLEGKSVSPSVVYLACPEQISNRLMEEISSQLSTMPMKIIPYDGPSILEDIKEYKPDLLDLLTCFEDKISHDPKSKQANFELLSALKSSNKSKSNAFYSDLSFFVGSFDSNLLLHLKLKIVSLDLELSEEKWELFKSDFDQIYQEHKINLIDKKIDEVERDFKKSYKSFKSKSNQNLMEKSDKLIATIESLTTHVEQSNRILASRLDSNNNPLVSTLSEAEYEHRQDIVQELKSIGLSNKVVEIPQLPNIDNPLYTGDNFYKDARILLSNIEDKFKKQEELICAQIKIKPKALYKAKISDYELKKIVNLFRKRYLRDVAKINIGELSQPKLKRFLTQTQEALSLLSKLSSASFSLSRNLMVTFDKTTDDRVSISAHDIFATGDDIAVYGGAGVGKTTTLRAYADLVGAAQESGLIYIQLNRLVDDLKIEIDKEDKDKISPTNLLNKIILLSKGMKLTPDNLEEAKSFFSKKVILILDGLDEIYSTIPNIVPAIAQFKEKNPNSQLIVSSRDCVSYLKEIRFLGITLLPFTKSQLNIFIRGWFNGSDTAESLINSIEKRDLYEHIKTPLLATITCTLVDKGVNAPSTENEIYSERLNLLTGEYDAHKNIERQKQKGHLLRQCAFKIAYGMHVKGVRSLPKGDMDNILVEYFSEKYDRKLLADCLDELINPCNILSLDPITKKYSFGHFRFQEHMVSEELKSNRGISLEERTRDDWWRGALSLYAQDNEFSFLFESIYNKYGNLSNSLMTLKSMIENSPEKGKQNLKSLLKGYIFSDKFDNMIIMDEDYGEFYDREYE